MHTNNLDLLMFYYQHIQDGDEVESGSHWSYTTKEEGSHSTAPTVEERLHLTATWFEEEDSPSTDMTVSFDDCKSAAVDHTVVFQPSILLMEMIPLLCWVHLAQQLSSEKSGRRTRNESGIYSHGMQLLAVLHHRIIQSDYIKRMTKTSEAELILGAKYRVTHKAWLGKWEANKKLYSDCRAKRIDPPPRQSVDLMRSDPDSMDSIIAAIESENQQMFEMLQDKHSFDVSLGID
ncbi:hypothetical protein COLO4_05303 [Corchorus olitorius]|uniref:Uncharacterized protein n=1 Tax=Corchorus olitorius TaxID=93759 RepID=A0A1R3KRA8_9ROSI|nr:hypothetical protein COLO4_05303 [Corchorus olitorius]